ncbi:MAG: fibrobacter succinogenes major paralogous domain-containing protein [Chitinispirillia bacterium]|nr:fibrobacter succinogenes major paralogous domain-containing protein [Chitinispirillia bacterium]MCL2242162.1 fibrobacter succinogenes major paralogous domain-containing protein [Chitinispirillia bacterium]
MSRLLISMAVAVSSVFLLFTACSDSGGGTVTPPPSGNTFTDSRDGKVYRVVTIGGQTWMAENLNYSAGGSQCYGEDGQVFVGRDENGEYIFTTLSNAEVQANCAKYGRLYNWAAVMGLPSSCNETECASQVQSKHRGICPSGWHVPSDAEWETLVKYVDPDATEDYGNHAGIKLKSVNGWEYFSTSTVGTDNYGFSALPGGNGYGSSFYNAGYYGFWWSATEGDAGNAWSRYMVYDDDGVSRGSYDKAGLFSLRCLRDSAAPQ